MGRASSSSARSSSAPASSSSRVVLPAPGSPRSSSSPSKASNTSATGVPAGAPAGPPGPPGRPAIPAVGHRLGPLLQPQGLQRAPCSEASSTPAIQVSRTRASIRWRLRRARSSARATTRGPSGSAHRRPSRRRRKSTGAHQSGRSRARGPGGRPARSSSPSRAARRRRRRGAARPWPGSRRPASPPPPPPRQPRAAPQRRPGRGGRAFAPRSGTTPAPPGHGAPGQVLQGPARTPPRRRARRSRPPAPATGRAARPLVAQQGAVAHQVQHVRALPQRAEVGRRRRLAPGGAAQHRRGDPAQGRPRPASSAGASTGARPIAGQVGRGGDGDQGPQVALVARWTQSGRGCPGSARTASPRW